jgi:hypothetical protein
VNRGERGEPLVRAMECQKLMEVDVRYTVTPGEHEGALAEIGRKPLQPAAILRLEPGVDQVDRPGVILQELMLAIGRR